MARNRPPSFDFYPEDFLAGTMHLHPACIGIYIRLLCFQWSHGAIPSDRRQLAQVTGALPEELDEHLSQVLSKFELGDDGLYRNARMERERERKMQYRDKQAANGKLGGRPPKGAEEKPKENPWVSSGLSKTKPKQKPPIGSGKKEEGITNKKEKRSAAETAGEWVIPSQFDTPEIRELLVEFEEMRIAKKVPIRDRRATSRVFKHFDDAEHLTYALEVCIANRWQGLDAKYRPPKRGQAVQKTFADLRVEGTQRAIEEFSNGGF
jgi:uncharacterized protein YdaU (DUF1376 family)